jgi:hypothetical protein
MQNLDDRNTDYVVVKRKPPPRKQNHTNKIFLKTMNRMKTVANLACYPLEPPLKNFLIRRSRIRPLTRKCSMIFRKSLNIKIIARITAFEF